MADKGMLDKTKGTIKEGVGKLTDNEKLELEGKKDKVVGKTKAMAHDAKEKGESLLDKAKNKFEDIKENVKEKFEDKE